MKRIFTALLVLVLGFTLIGCGKKVSDKHFEGSLSAIYSFREDGAKVDFQIVHFEKGASFKTLDKLPSLFDEYNLPTLKGWNVIDLNTGGEVISEFVLVGEKTSPLKTSVLLVAVFEETK